MPEVMQNRTVFMCRGFLGFFVYPPSISSALAVTCAHVSAVYLLPDISRASLPSVVSLLSVQSWLSLPHMLSFSSGP